LKQDGLTRKKVADKLSTRVEKFPAHRVQMYTDRGIIKPDVVNAKGRGTTRKYSNRNLLQIAIIGELREISLSLKDIKRVFDLVEKLNPVDRLWFDPDGEHLTKGLLFMVIKNPGRDDMDVGLDLRIDPAKFLPVGLEKHREDLTKKRDLVTVKMEQKTTVVILNISKIWEKIGV